MKQDWKIYEYNKCSTCKNALKFLDQQGISYEKIPIVDQPPSADELTQVLAHLKKQGKTFKNLFNTSGVQYREQKIAQKIQDGMSEGQAIQLLSQNGKLIKRPLAIGKNDHLIGFRLEEWKKIFN